MSDVRSDGEVTWRVPVGALPDPDVDLAVPHPGLALVAGMTENPGDYLVERDRGIAAAAMAPESEPPLHRSAPDSAVDDAERRSDPGGRQDAELTDE